MVSRMFSYIILHVPTYLGKARNPFFWTISPIELFLPIWDPNSYKTVLYEFVLYNSYKNCMNWYKNHIVTNSHYTICITIVWNIVYEFVQKSHWRIPPIWIRIKTMERTAKKTILKKLKVPPLGPGMKESVDKCTKKNKIQSQKWQYEIAHMYNLVRKNSCHHPQQRIIRFHSYGIVNPFFVHNMRIDIKSDYYQFYLLKMQVSRRNCPWKRGREKISGLLTWHVHGLMWHIHTSQRAHFQWKWTSCIWLIRLSQLKGIEGYWIVLYTGAWFAAA